MAFNPTQCAADLRSALLGDAAAKAVDNPALTALCEKIANIVLAHIATNGVVTVAPGIAVATTGTAAAQTGATTAPGTGTIA